MKNFGKKKGKVVGTPVDTSHLEERHKARRLAREARNLAREMKRKLREESQRVPIIPPKDLVQHQLIWINRNCQPKVRPVPRFIPRRKPTRWAKRGPMSKRDWMRFYKWADKNAEPKKIFKPLPLQKLSKKKTSEFDEVSPEDVIAHIEKLSTPKLPRKKYEPPPPEVFPYSPKIFWNQPAKHDRGRPFPPPKVPVDFQHIEIEIDFWSKLRFPIRPSALKYTPSENILILSKPRITPPSEPHCPIPKKPKEYVEPRRKMTRRQWLEYQERLDYLARPVFRPVMELEYD